MPSVQPEYRTILAVDIVAFSSPERTDPIRLRLHQRLRRICDALLRQIGAGGADGISNDTGDGFIYSIDPSVSKTLLLDRLVPRLARRLERENAARPRNEEMRLRVAVHAGEVLRDPKPLVGVAVIHACRLLDAEPLRACLRVTDRPLALVVSQAIYDNVVRQEYGRIQRSAFHAVIAAVKETTEHAWVHVPGDASAPLRAGVVATDADLQALGRPRPPRELPGRAANFTGRDRERDALRAALTRDGERRAAAVVAVTGSGGIGKSALAIEVAHLLADQFPDGQLYLDLQGWSPRLAPLSPLDGLQHFLRSLGMGEADLPTTVDSASARYRSLLAGKTMLIVLDNAHDAEQVRPALPGGATCAVLITSRRTLGDLEGASLVRLATLSPADSLALLRQLAGARRIDDEPQAAAMLAHHCGYLPLALRIAASRLRDRPTWSVEALAARLADVRQRLEHLQIGDLEVRASLEVSYRRLLDRELGGAEIGRAFLLLGLPDGPDIDVEAASALLGVPPRAAEAALERLVDEHLLATARGRYRLHDLLRALAHELAARDLPGQERDAARRRLLRFYLDSARAADRMLLRPSESFQVDGPAGEAVRFADRRAALAWFERERPNLVAAVEQAAHGETIPAEVVTGLAHALSSFLRLHSHLQDAQRCSRLAFGIARVAGGHRDQAEALNDLGLVALQQYRLDEATSLLQQSLALHRLAGDRSGERRALNNLGTVHERRRRYPEAVECYEQSIAIARELGDRLAEGRTLANLGVVRGHQRRYDEALDCHRQSLAICQEFGDRQGESTALNGIGRVHSDQGRYAEAIDHYLRDLAICEELGDRHAAGMALHDLGDAERGRGRPRAAVAHHERSLQLHREIGNLRGEAQTLGCLADDLDDLGLKEQAARCRQESAALNARLGEPDGG